MSVMMTWLSKHLEVILQVVLIIVLCFSVYYSYRNNRIITERESFILDSRKAYADILKKCGN
jgi:hypothetical protein